MAAISNTFSIREYVMKMRSVDVARCWPFDGANSRTGGGEDDGGLPPMTCRKFRWWSSERARITVPPQERSLSTESGNQIQDLETGGGDNRGDEGGFEDEDDDRGWLPTSADGREDGLPGDGRRRAKLRVPKKRSIVEIFAQAPEVAGDGGDGDEEEKDTMEKKQTKAMTSTKMIKIKKKRKKKKKKMLTMKKMRKKNKNGGVSEKLVTKRKRSAHGEEVDVERANMKKKKKKKKMMMVDTVMESVLSSTPCAGDAKGKFHTLKTALPAHSSGVSKDASSGRQLGKVTEVSTVIKKKIATNKRKILKKDQAKSKQQLKRTMKHEKDKTSTFPFDSILKTQTMTSSLQRTSTSHEKDHNLAISCTSQVQQSVRRVRFSGKDDILGQKNTNHPFMDSLPIKSPSNEFSEVMAGPSLQKLSCLATETDCVSEDVLLSKNTEAVCGSRLASASTIEGDGSRCPNDSNVKDFHHRVMVDSDALSHSRSSTDVPKSSPLESVDLNQASDSSCMVSLQYTVHHADHRQQECLSIARSNQEFGTQTENSIPWVSNINNRLQAIDRIKMSDIPVSMPYLSKSVDSSGAGSSKRMNMELTLLKPDLIQPSIPGSSNCLVHYQSSCALSSKDLMARGHSPPMLNQLFPAKGESWMSLNSLEPISDTVKLSRERFVNEDFIGLPVNSQGGLTSMHDQIFRKHTVVSGPTNAFPLSNIVEPRDAGANSSHEPAAHSYGHLNFLSKRSHYKVNDLVNVASQTKSDSLELKDLGQPETDVDSTNLFGVGFRQIDQPPDYKRKEGSREFDQCLGSFSSAFQSSSLPTMRLMGKTVTVGRNCEIHQGSKDPIIWSDKEVISQHGPFTVSDNLLRNQSLQSERIIHPVPEPTFAAFSFNHKPQLVSKDALPIVMGRIGTKHHNISHSVASHAALERPIQILGTQVTGKESSHINYPRSPMFSGPAQTINHADHVDYRTASSFCLPVPTSDCQGSFQFSWPQPAISGMPPWLLSATIKDCKMPSPQTHSGPTCRQYLCSLSSTSPSPSEPYIAPSFPSALHKARPDCSPLIPYHALVAPSSSHKHSSHSFTEHSCHFNSLGNPQLLQGYPGSEHGHSFNGSGNPSVSIRKKRKSSHVSYLPGGNFAPPSKKFKKKVTVAANANGNTAESTSCRKTETVKLQAETAKKKQHIEHLHCDASTAALSICRDGAVDIGVSGSTSCSKTSAIARPGPIKLSAGAKHILKPGQKMDKISSTLTHSTLPFTDMSSSKGLDLKKKTARIYRF